MLHSNSSSKLRTLLVLGRVSNLPTVWSNCLAGWWLGGGGALGKLGWVCLGASLLYLGGMFLNDAFDTEFDRMRRSLRPIPSGRISEKEVCRWAIAWLVLGSGCLFWISLSTAILTLFLAVAIVIYNAVHKFTPLAPLIMAGCRFLLFLVAASAGISGVTGLAVWSGLALACYVLSLSSLAAKESIPSHAHPGVAVFLAAPVLLAGLVNADGALALFLALILITWVTWSLRHTFWSPHPNIGFSVSRLLAGITLVDLLAVADFSQGAIWFFPFWFLLCLFLQRFVPAT